MKTTNCMIQPSSRRHWLAAFVASASCVFALVPQPARASIAVGDPFPSLASAGLTGPAQPATSGKVVIVDFWASWCAPCKASFPAYGRLNSDFASKGLVIIAISVDEDEKAYAAFVKRFNPGFYVALDSSHSLVRSANVPTMPTSYVLDRSGRVRHIHAGFHGADSEREIRTEVAALLAENAP
jgi:thiol-disulfide isomerase/thioredoxin